MNTAIGRHISKVDGDVTIIKRNGPSLGLHLNITKYELILSVKPVQSQSLNEFIAVSPPDASLLDAPLFPWALQYAALNKKLEEFKRLSSNIKSINAHDALLILKASSSTPALARHMFLSCCAARLLLAMLF